MQQKIKSIKIKKLKLDNLKINPTKAQIARMQKQIREKENTMLATGYSDISYQTFIKVMDNGSPLRKTQLEKLLEFCEIIESGVSI